MAGSSDWPIERMPLSKLRLDPANVRIRGTIDDEDAILTHLLQRDDALTLVKDIARDGYFDNEQPIVYLDGEDYIVLEGNRRVTALKVLDDPERLPAFTARVQSAIARSEDPNFPNRIRVMIAPSKAAALQVIARLHTRNSKKSWVLEQQATFYYDRILDGETLQTLQSEYPAETKIARFITMGQMMAWAREAAAGDETAEEFVDSAKFSMTTFEYLYNSASFRQKFDMTVRSGQVTMTGHSPDFLRRLYIQILLDMKAGRINTRNIRADDATKAYVERLYSIAEGTRLSPDEDPGPAVAESDFTDLHSPDPDDEETPADEGDFGDGDVGGVDPVDGDVDGEARSAPNDSGSDTDDDGSDTGVPDDAEEDGGARSSSRRSVADYRLDFRGMTLGLTEPGMRQRYWELEHINVKDFPNATFDIMRTFLECAIKSYFLAAGNPVVRLDHREDQPIQLTHCLSHLAHFLADDDTVKRAMPLLRTRQFNFATSYHTSLAAFNDSNHEPDVVFTRGQVNEMWSQLKPLVRLLATGPAQGQEVA